MTGSNESHRRLPSPWLIALAAVGLYWLALGWRHVADIAGNPLEIRPFVLAGLCAVAAIGLLNGGRVGRVVAAVIAIVGAAWALAVVLSLATAITAFTPVNALGFLVIYLGIAAGYALVFVRAVRGR